MLLKGDFCHGLFICQKIDYFHGLYIFQKCDYCHGLYICQKCDYCHAWSHLSKVINDTQVLKGSIFA
jgi:hypothetical protein